jgi:tetratricopeptide (TPR) repeat protein
MKGRWTGALCALALLVAGAGLAARLDCWFLQWPGNRAKTWNPLDVFVGQGQRLFGSHFYRKADVYFHQGFYPSIFDNNAAFQTEHMAADADLAHDRNAGDEHEFLGKPRDLIERFSRHFFPSQHTHLGDEDCAHDHNHDHDHAPAAAGQDGNAVREILPWLRIAATLDPEMPETYTVAAYWLRERMGKDREAEQFLREGLKHLPNHPQLLFELGRIYRESRNDPDRARNLWRHASRVSPGWKDNANPEERFILLQIESRLAKLAEDQHDLPAAIAHWQNVARFSPGPEHILEHIAQLRQRMATGTNAVPFYLQP